MIKYFLSILYFCLSFHLTFANATQTKIDSIIQNVTDYTDAVQKIRKLDEESLLLYVNTTTDALTKAKIYNGLCWQYFNSDPPKAMEYAKLQYTFAEILKDEKVIVKAYDNLAWLHQGFNDHEESIKLMLKALKINEHIGSKSGISLSLSGLANNYYILSNYRLALNYFEQSLQIERLEDNWENEAATLMNIGLCYVGLQEVDLGLSNYLKVVDIYINNQKEIEAATVYLNIGFIYLNDKKDYVQALFYFKKAEKSFLELENVSSLASVYGVMSKLYTKEGDLTNALIYGEKAVENAILSKSKSVVMSTNDNLAFAFYMNKDYKLAYDHFKIAYELKDTIFNATSSKQIAEMQTKYDTEKKEAENQLLITEKELDKAKIEKKDTQQKLLLIVLTLILLVVIYVVYSLQQKKKTNKLLLIKNDKINTQKEIIEEKNKDITDSINYAQRIQDTILPDLSILNKYYESFVYYQPKDIVSGDFYWIKEIGNKIYFAVVDCTGHGVPGALMSMIGVNSLNKIIEDLKIENPGKILDELNELVIQALNKEKARNTNDIIKDGMDMSICVIDKQSNQLTYAGAKNPFYLYRNLENKLDELEPVMENDTSLFYEIKPDKMKIGGATNNKNYSSHTVQLQKNDTIYLFSDGYVDQFGGTKGKKFMYKPFKQLLLSIQTKTMEDQHQHIDATFKQWMGDYMQLDDICIMGVRI